MDIVGFLKGLIGESYPDSLVPATLPSREPTRRAFQMLPPFAQQLLRQAPADSVAVKTAHIPLTNPNGQAGERYAQAWTLPPNPPWGEATAFGRPLPWAPARLDNTLAHEFMHNALGQFLKKDAPWGQKAEADLQRWGFSNPAIGNTLTRLHPRIGPNHGLPFGALHEYMASLFEPTENTGENPHSARYRNKIVPPPGQYPDLENLIRLFGGHQLY